MRVLVAGATGLLGSEVLSLLAEGEHWTRALTRRPEALAGLEGEADEVVVAAGGLSTATLNAACAGIDVVFSSVGQSMTVKANGSRAAFEAVDAGVNLSLLAAAERAGVRRFVYVAAFGSERLPQLAYTLAQKRVVSALRASAIDSCVVRPTRLFGSYAESLLAPRRRRFSPVVGNGSVRTNPIHEVEAARACLDAIEGAQAEVAVGGPEALKRADEAKMIAAAMDWRRPAPRMPALAAEALGRFLQPIDPRRSAVLRYLAATDAVDLVAPVYGQQSLGDYLIETAPR